MSAMSLGTGDAHPTRRREMTYTEPHTKPAHIIDKRGSSGTPQPVITNYFKLERANNLCLYQYHVDFSPEIDSKGLRIGLVKEHKEMLKPIYAFDGMQLYMARKLEQSETEVYSERRSDGEKIRLTLKLTGELPPSAPTSLHMYNIVFRKVLSMMDMKQIGRHYFSPQHSIHIEQYKMEVWPGFITSILQYETEIMLCADISHKVLRSDTVLDALYELYQKSAGGRFNFHDTAAKDIIGQIVLTRYNNKTYRVDDIKWDGNPSSTFKKRDEDISYIDYYKKTHDIPIHDMEQPLLVSLPKKSDIRRGQPADQPYMLIPELCTLTGITEKARTDFNLMKAVHTQTRVAPDGRAKTLEEFVRKMQSNAEVVKELQGWGLKFSNKLVDVNARVLKPEFIFMKETKFAYAQNTGNWENDMRSAKMISSIPLANWIVITIGRFARETSEFCNALQRVGGPLGCRVNEPIMCQIDDDRTDTYLRTMRSKMDATTNLIMLILPTNRKDRYDAIKKFTCVDHPVPSQVMVAKTLKKNTMSVATKVLMQINAKMGGEIWAVEIPMKNYMCVGIDTYHDSAKKGRSVGALVASLNQNCTRFYSSVTFQHTHQELLDQIKVSLTSALKKYHEVNGFMPERIFIYRDGVGDGQLPAVVEHEIPQMLETFKMLGADYDPKVSVVVVKKRINTRFMVRQGNRIGNPPPGTIVDTEVTRAESYDFFLVSQSVKQGSVAPTHYNIVWDTSAMKPDHLQRLTYKLCHLYYNVAATIRVPAPCHYAHKLAFLVGQSLHHDPSIELADKLFFL